jgi:hypothetical protein
MPGPIIIPNVWQVTLKWDPFAGVKARNVLHFESASGTKAQLAAAMNTNLKSAMFGAQSLSMLVNRVGIMHLDGTDPEADFPVSQSGNHSGTDCIPQLCQIISLRTTQRGPRGRGRIFLGPVVEGAQASGVIDPTVVPVSQTAWETFKTDMATAAGNWNLVVASRKHLSFATVETLISETQAATQRRRMQQLR